MIRNNLVVSVYMMITALFVLSGCSKKENRPEVRLKEKVTFCTGGNIQLTPLVAAEKGFFAANGLEGDVVNLGDGKKAIETFLAGDCTYGLLADPPVIKHAFSRNDFAIIAALSLSDSSVRILSRRDKGVEKPADLKGKRIGIKKGINSHVFADLFMKKHGLSGKDGAKLEFVDLKEMPAALDAGSIDAYSASSTYFMEGRKLLKEKAAVFSEPGLYLNCNYLLAKRDFLDKKSETARKTLKALLQAEEFIASRPADAAAVLARKMKISDQEAAELLKDEQIGMALSDRQLLSLGSNAKALMAIGALDKKELPDFRKLIVTEPLKAVKPAGVTLN